MIPTKYDKYFQGWSLRQTARAADYLPGKAVILSSDIVLYAVWGDELVDFDVEDDKIDHPANPTFEEIVDTEYLSIRNGEMVYSEDGTNWIPSQVPLPSTPVQGDDYNWAFIEKSDNEIVALPNRGAFSGRMDDHLHWDIKTPPVDPATVWESLVYIGDN